MVRSPEGPRLADFSEQVWQDLRERGHSWLNMVERWFRELTDKAIRRGDFKSVPDLIAAIEAYLKANNEQRRPQTLRVDRHR
jgi:hypothetical protein